MRLSLPSVATSSIPIVKSTSETPSETTIGNSNSERDWAEAEEVMKELKKQTQRIRAQKRMIERGLGYGGTRGQCEE